MESSNTALRAKNDAAAARELRFLRADTLEGLNHLRSLINVECRLTHDANGYCLGRIVNDLKPDGAHTHFDPSAHDTLDAAITLLQNRWPV